MCEHVHSCEITIASICIGSHKFTNSISHVLAHLSFTMTTNNKADHTLMHMRLSNEVKQLAQDSRAIIKWQHQHKNGNGSSWQPPTACAPSLPQATWMPGSLLGDDGVRSGMFTAAWCPPTFQALHDSSLGAGLCGAPGRLVQSVGKPSQRESCPTHGGGHMGPWKRFWLDRVNPAGTGPVGGCIVIGWLQHPWSRNHLPGQRLFPQQ